MSYTGYHISRKSYYKSPSRVPTLNVSEQKQKGAQQQHSTFIVYEHLENSSEFKMFRIRLGIEILISENLLDLAANIFHPLWFFKRIVFFPLPDIFIILNGLGKMRFNMLPVSAEPESSLVPVLSFAHKLLKGGPRSGHVRVDIE